MKRWIGALAALTVWGLAAGGVEAEVQDNAPHGFKVGGQVTIDAAPEAVWAVLVQPSEWWESDHTWFGQASGLSLDLRPGGCWCETGPDGAGAVHMTVGHVAPGQSLRLVGALGPLQTLGVAGGLQFTLTPEGAGTRLDWSYTVGGYATGGLEAWAGPVDGVLVHQLGRLKAATED